MKINIRKNVFETNSSSSHSLVVATKTQKEQFENGVLWFNITHCWGDDRCLKDPKTGERLPAFVDFETAENVYRENRKAEKKDIFLSEKLINAVYVLEFGGNPYDGMEAKEREDGKYDLDICHFFG